MKTTRTFAALLLALAACGDSATESKDQPLVVLECTEGFSPTTLVGVRQLAEGDCLDTEESVVLELCSAADGFDIPLLACVQNEGGERYWVRNHDQNLGETPGFTPCSEAEEVPPPPCFVGDCGPDRTAYPNSNCSQEETEAVLRCGEPDSPWDENCCLRPFCVDGACDPGFVCTPVAGLEAWTYPYATTNSEGAIVCDNYGQWGGGFFGCFPE